MYEVTNLREYLAGCWRLSRTVVDQWQSARGSLQGHAFFASTDYGLCLTEQGRLRLGDFHGPARQRYQYVLSGTGQADIRFADGRHFCGLSLTTGQCKARHHCGEDIYRGIFTAISPDALDVVWTVDGPRKKATIHSRYRFAHSL